MIYIEPSCIEYMVIDIKRYSRQIMLDDIGLEGQERMADATVTVIGAGGLGTPVLHRLVSMGVGNIKVIDRDFIELSNLHRQYLYTDKDIGHAKVDVITEKLLELEPKCKITAVNAVVTDGNIKNFIKGSDVVVDALDTVRARYSVNNACVSLNIPLVSGGAIMDKGQVVSRDDNSSACFACIFPSLDDKNFQTCGMVGVNPAILGMVGSVMVSEIIKMLVGKKPSLRNKLLHIDMATLDFIKVDVKKAAECPVCNQDNKTNTISNDVFIEDLCSRESGKRAFSVGMTNKNIKISNVIENCIADDVVFINTDQNLVVDIDRVHIQFARDDGSCIVSAPGNVSQDDIEQIYLKLTLTK